MSISNLNVNVALSADVTFSRVLLAAVHRDVKREHPTINVRKAWVWRAGRDSWEFHFPGFCWHGRAANAYEARAKGWQAWLANPQGKH